MSLKTFSLFDFFLLKPESVEVFKDKVLKMDQITVGLVGELGSGKTSFVSYFAGRQACSPTFTLCNSYECFWNSRSFRVSHWDFYRLNSFPVEILEDLSDVIFIEWIDKFPQSYFELKLSFLVSINARHHCYAFSAS